ncbi:hypothetical protein SBADM41S_11843 [Streptomyces badius]
MAAVWQMEVEDFRAFIVVDDKGNDFCNEPAPAPTLTSMAGAGAGAALIGDTRPKRPSLAGGPHRRLSADRQARGRDQATPRWARLVPPSCSETLRICSATLRRLLPIRRAMAASVSPLTTAWRIARWRAAVTTGVRTGARSGRTGTARDHATSKWRTWKRTSDGCRTRRAACGSSGYGMNARSRPKTLNRVA